MSSNINTVLDDFEKQATLLVEEIQKYSAAGAISNQMAASLQKLCQALEDIRIKIQPLSEITIRRIIFILLGAMALNVILMLIIIWFK